MPTPGGVAPKAVDANSDSIPCHLRGPEPAASLSLHMEMRHCYHHSVEGRDN